jgi:hypothetical protein
MMALRKGNALPAGATLRSNVQIMYAVLPAGGTDDSRSAAAVQKAALASLSHLLLPMSGDTFNRVTVLMTEDGRIDQQYVELRRKDQLRPYGDIDPAGFGTLWEPLGLKPEQLGTMGITNIYQGAAPMMVVGASGTALPKDNRTWMIVRYAWPRRPGEPMGGKPQSPATAALANQVPFTNTDAAKVVAHHLPGALNDTGSSPQGVPWLVLSRDGRVLRSGYLPPAQQQMAPLQMVRASPLQAAVPDLTLAETWGMPVIRQYRESFANGVMFAWVAADATTPAAPK